MNIFKKIILNLISLIIVADQKRNVTSPELVSRWRSPLSCSTDESIENIDFDNEHIVLVIDYWQKGSKKRLEFRTRGMLVLRYFALNNYADSSILPLLLVKDGWILGQQKERYGPRQYTLIDADLCQHEQNFLTAQCIENIAVVNYPWSKKSLVICHEKNGVHMLGDGNQTLVLDLYEIQ